MVIFDKMLKFLEVNQEFLYLNKDCDFNDVVFEFEDDDYTDYGWKINTNIFQLNFAGCSDWFYFISVPNTDLKNYKNNLDQYPIYSVDLESGVLKKESNNFRDFFKRWFNDEKLKYFSKKCIKQEIPKCIEIQQDI